MTDPTAVSADQDADERLLDAVSEALSLGPEPAWRPEILGYMKGIAAAYRLVEAFPLPDDLEPAPVFRA